jgi:transposase
MRKIPFLKLPDTLSQIRISLNKDKYDSINIYYQDESRFGLKTFVGRCLSVVGVRPLVNYQHKFENTYLWGSYSPITGDSFVWEINGVDAKIFEAYLKELSRFKPKEFKVVVIDNAAFHSTNNIKIPENIFLLNIPPYCPELNPCEQIWQYIKKRYKNKTFDDMAQLKQWLWNTVCEMDKDLIKSIVANKRYKNIIYSNLL